MHHRQETRMNTEISTIGNAVLIQSLIRYAAYVLIAWLILSFADGWIMAAIS